MTKTPRLAIGTRVRDKFKLPRAGDNVTMGTIAGKVVDKMVKVKWDAGDGFRSEKTTVVAIMMLEVVDDAD